MASLYGTLALAEVDDVAVGVAQDLKFDMVGLLDETLYIYRVISERRQCFGFSGEVGLFDLTLAADEPHAFSSTSLRSLDHDGETDLAAHLTRILDRFEILAGSGNHRDTRIDHLLPGRDLVAHCFDRFGSRADEDDVGFLAAAGKLGIFRQKSISRVDGIRSALPCGFQNPVDVQVAFARGCPADAISLIGIKDMFRRPVGFREDGYRPDVHLTA